MTTFEHALLGINGVLACGLHRRWGWKLVALGGVGAIAPDWDGLPMLIDMARFETGHRVWGHSVPSCLLLGMAVGTVDYRFDLSGRVLKRLASVSAFKPLAVKDRIRTQFQTSEWFLWMLVAALAALSQIPADAVVSGGKGLSDWPLKPLWPFSNWEFVWPMVPWGNLGITFIFASVMLLQLKWPGKLRGLAQSSLAAVFAYVFAWGTLVGR